LDISPAESSSSSSYQKEVIRIIFNPFKKTEYLDWDIYKSYIDSLEMFKWKKKVYRRNAGLV
jgi:CRISPR/Cas system CSM-associated protein Csm4 (group 5 of RAMP superfamily)